MFFYWWTSRKAALDATKMLMRHHLQTHTELIVAAAEDVLTKMQTSVELLAGLSAEPGVLIQCNLESIFQFVRMAKLMRQNTDFPPSRFTLGKENESFCELNFSSTSISHGNSQQNEFHTASVKNQGTNNNENLQNNSRIDSRTNSQNFSQNNSQNGSETNLNNDLLNNNKNQNNIQKKSNIQKQRSLEELQDLKRNLLSKSNSTSSSASFSDKTIQDYQNDSLSDSFVLYYSYFNSTSNTFIINEFNETTDLLALNESNLSDFDVKEEEEDIRIHFPPIDHEKNGNNTFWSFQYSSFKENFYQIITAVSPTGLSSSVSVSLPLQSLADALFPVSLKFECKSAVVSDDSRAIIGSSIGVVSPLNITEDNFPLFPKLGQLDSTYWESVSSLLSVHNIKPGELNEVTINDSSHYIVLSPIRPHNKTILFLLSVFRPGNYIEDLFFAPAIVFVVFLVFICLLYIVIAWLTRRNKMQSNTKLLKSQPKPKKTVKGEVAKLGTLGTSILRLRKLQLLFPEDTLFNKVLDNAILNLAEHQTHVFSVAKVIECDFCSYLIPKTAISLHSSKTQQHHCNNNVNNNNNNGINIDNNNIKNSVNNNVINNKQNNVANNKNSNNNMSAIKEKIAFSKWKQIRSKLNCYENLGTLNFPLSFHLTSPVPKLISLMVSIIMRENLFFPEFDPDQLIKFMVQFASCCCRDNVRTAHNLFSLYYLMNVPFKHWLPNRFDRFILYFSCFVNRTDCMVAFDEEFSQSTEEVWNGSTTGVSENTSFSHLNNNSSNNNNNNNDSDNNNNNDYNNSNNLNNNNNYANKIGVTVNHKDDNNNNNINEEEEEEDYTEPSAKLRLYIDAFNDAESCFERNVQLIFDLLNEFLGIPNKKVRTPTDLYFENSVIEILRDVLDSRQFLLFGELSVRVQSPEFSILDDQSDRLLFMKAILRLADFCPYWSPHEVMLDSSPRIAMNLFNENEDLRTEFNLQNMSLIIAPWIDVMANFSPLDEVVTNFNYNLNYWKQKMKGII